MNALTQTLQGMSKGRLLMLAGIAAGMIGFFVFMTSQLTAPNQTLLYGNLEMEDAAEISARLDSMGVPYKLSGNGSQILVPSDRALHLRMALAEEGLPASGSVGYEIFDRSESLGTTNLVQNINMVRALEGELARTISSFDKVSAARVHLVIPRRELFSRQQLEASASIALKLRGNSQLSRQQIAATQNLVAAAVPGLDPGRITIVDDQGNLLARGAGPDEDAAIGAASGDDYRMAYEERVTQTIESLLERSVGLGKVRAQVNVEMDFDRFTTNSETYDPDGQVIRSAQTIEEINENSDSEGSGQAVSVGNNLPDADESTGSGQSTASSTNSRVEETVNYEISKTITSHLREGGTVKRVSVAVLVDGIHEFAEDGTESYTARSDEELEQLTALVKSAVGFDEERGDSVEVINMPFVSVVQDIPEGEAPMLGLVKTDYFKILEIIVLGFVAVLVVLLVLRPLVGKLAAPGGAGGLATQAAGGAPAQLAAPRESPAQLAAPQTQNQGEGENRGEGGQLGGNGDEADDSAMIDIARVEGRVQASAARKIGEIVEKHPEEALAIVRNWLYEGA